MSHSKPPLVRLLRPAGQFRRKSPPIVRAIRPAQRAFSLRTPRSRLRRGGPLRLLLFPRPHPALTPPRSCLPAPEPAPPLPIVVSLPQSFGHPSFLGLCIISPSEQFYRPLELGLSLRERMLLLMDTQ